ncbi:Hypothetical predicted protein [Pelobates cultripes]|uniref:Uncharacterized protein n=1 Tax=Pelobates cultripes TaxID=61616 RepID=A0AAD1R9I4_PELCU|nr:Hypothetical predicted protein [Pelobates cultripes]
MAHHKAVTESPTAHSDSHHRLSKHLKRATLATDAQSHAGSRCNQKRVRKNNEIPTMQRQKPPCLPAASQHKRGKGQHNRTRMRRSTRPKMATAADRLHRYSCSR